MNEVESQTEVFEPVVSGETGRAIVAVVGIAIWAQLVFGGLGTEVGLATPSPVVLATYLAPPIILIAGTYLGSVPILLFVFPLMLMAAVAFVPDADTVAFFTPWSMVRIAATFAIYQALASAWATSSRIATPLGRELVESTDSTTGPYRTHVLTRLAPFLLIWLVPSYAIFFDETVVGTFNQSFGDASTIAQIFVSTSIFLAWAIVGYTSFIVPALNLEYDSRKLQKRYARGSKLLDRTRIGLRIAATVAAGLIFIVTVSLLTG